MPSSRKSLILVLVTLMLILSRSGFNQIPDTDLQRQILSAKNRVLPALVHVEPIRTVFSTGERRHTRVTGSGFIFSGDGYILTNHHVVENAEKVSCTLSNKKKVSAEIIGSDPSTDVAVLKLNEKEWTANEISFVVLGNSDSVEVGQLVLALGSPLGLSRSVSMGVISSIDRYFENSGSMVSPYNLWIQTDAAINPGNSGGPLINLNGEVVGINARGVFLAENLGFAIPINLAREIADKLIEGNTIQRSWIGLELQPVKELREYLEKPDIQGVLIASLEPLSPGLKTGLQPGDVVVSIDGKPVNANFEEDLPAIRKIIADLPVNQKATVEIRRDYHLQKMEVIPELEPFQDLPEFECEEWGMVIKSITRHIFQVQALTDYDGVYVSAVKSGGPCEKAGIKAGDIIRTVNKQKIIKLQDFKALYLKLGELNPSHIFFELQRQATPRFAAIAIRPDKD